LELTFTFPIAESGSGCRRKAFVFLAHCLINDAPNYNQPSYLRVFNMIDEAEVELEKEKKEEGTASR